MRIFIVYRGVEKSQCQRLPMNRLNLLTDAMLVGELSLATNITTSVLAPSVHKIEMAYELFLSRSRSRSRSRWRSGEGLCECFLRFLGDLLSPVAKKPLIDQKNNIN